MSWIKVPRHYAEAAQGLNTVLHEEASNLPAPGAWTMSHLAIIEKAMDWLEQQLRERSSQLDEANEQIVAYQTRVDNDLLRLKAAYSLAGSE